MDRVQIIISLITTSVAVLGFVVACISLSITMRHNKVQRDDAELERKEKSKAINKEQMNHAVAQLQSDSLSTRMSALFVLQNLWRHLDRIDIENLVSILSVYMREHIEKQDYLLTDSYRKGVHKDVNLVSSILSNIFDALSFRADLSRLQAEKVDLQNLQLRGVNLSCANLENANILHTNLRGANLSQAKGLTASDLRFAEIDDTTIIDEELLLNYLRMKTNPPPVNDLHFRSKAVELGYKRILTERTAQQISDWEKSQTRKAEIVQLKAQLEEANAQQETAGH